jgi:hypothetical protein
MKGRVRGLICGIIPAFARINWATTMKGRSHGNRLPNWDLNPGPHKHEAGTPSLTVAVLVSCEGTWYASEITLEKRCWWRWPPINYIL